MTPEVEKALVRAQQFAANVAVSGDDPDLWVILRMEARSLRDALHTLRTGEVVVDGEVVEPLPEAEPLVFCTKCGAQGTEPHRGVCVPHDSARRVPRWTPE